MATVNFLYRSTREKAPLDLRLLYRHDDKDIVIGAKTRFVVSKKYWKEEHQKQRIKDFETKNFQEKTKKHIGKLESHILKAFYKADENDVSKDWLKSQIDTFYNPSKDKKAPKDLVSFIDFYLETKQNDLSEVRKKRIKVVRSKLQRFEEQAGQKISIKNVNDTFKKDFTNYSTKNNYSQNTQQTEISIIRTICTYANQWGIKTSPQLKGMKLKPERIKNIYLDFNELEILKKLDLSGNERLDNARDWLLISCHTGQRISDFMRFSPDMVRTKKGKKGREYYLDFRQKKTDKLMSIPFIKEAQEVLEKRNGQFPRPISDQRYNEYIKEVCRIAGFDSMVKGKKRICIAKEGKKPTKNDYRKIPGTFQKWELVTSHIGRRSFATNHYGGGVPTAYLKYITGHSTEKMLLNYINKGNKDLAADAYNYF